MVHLPECTIFGIEDRSSFQLFELILRVTRTRRQDTPSPPLLYLPTILGFAA